MDAFLNVTASLTGRRWIGPTVEVDRLAEALAQTAALPRALCADPGPRAGSPPEAAAAFLEPKLRDLLPDPLPLKDMDGPPAFLPRSGPASGSRSLPITTSTAAPRPP